MYVFKKLYDPHHSKGSFKAPIQNAEIRPDIFIVGALPSRAFIAGSLFLMAQQISLNLLMLYLVSFRKN